MIQPIQCEDCGHTFDHGEEKGRTIKCPICKAEVHYVLVIVGEEPNTQVYKGGTMTKTNQQIIYEDANRLFGLQEYTASVILVHTACEIATVRTLHHAIQFNNLLKYYDLIAKSTRTTHITSNEILKWYKALTDDTMITDQPFWGKLGQSAKLRHRIVHLGEKATMEEAKEALDVVIELFKYFGQQRRKFREAQNIPNEIIVLELEEKRE